MTVQAGDVIKVVVDQTYPGGWSCQNVFYWLLPEGSDEMADSTVLGAVTNKIEAMWEELELFMKSTYTMDSVSIVVVEWDETEGKWETVRTVGSYPLDVTFAGTTDLMPPYVTAFLTGFTNGIKTRARKSLSGIVEGAQAIGVPGGGTLTALGLWAAEWLVDVVLPDNNELQAVVVNKLGQIWNVVSVVLGDRLGTQNTRKFGIGD